MVNKSGQAHPARLKNLTDVSGASSIALRAVVSSTAETAGACVGRWRRASACESACLAPRRFGAPGQA